MGDAADRVRRDRVCGISEIATREFHGAVITSPVRSDVSLQVVDALAIVTASAINIRSPNKLVGCC
jgi:hypothetical protein